MNAADLNNLYSAFRAFKLSATFKARYAGVDAITGARFPAGISVRMLVGKPLLPNPYNGGAGVEVLSLCARLDGRFVDDVSTDGVYYTVNARGEGLGFKLTAGRVTFAGWKHAPRSLAAMRSQKLRHQIALIATDLKEIF